MKVLITGCSNKSIGGDIARRLFKQGHEIIGICKYGDEVDVELFTSSIESDFSDMHCVSEAFNFILLNHSDIDVYINATGMSSISWFRDIDFKDYEKSMNVNCNSFIKSIEILLPILSINKSLVINIISSAANIPMRCSLSYNVSKAALQMATKQLARELTPSEGVCFLGVNPSKISGTNMTLENDEIIKKTRGWSDEEYSEIEKSNSPSGELLDKMQVSEFIKHLIETRSDTLSGSIFEFGV